MKVTYITVSEGLAPLHDNDKENHTKLTNGALYQKDFKKVRNPEFHGLVFGMLNDVFKFQDQFDDFEAFRRRIKLLSGSYEEHAIIDGKGKAKIMLELKSWEWGKMDEYEFREIFVRIKTACAHHFCKTNEQFEIINNCD